MEDIRPKLEDRESFERVLLNYKMSPHEIEILSEIDLVVMSGLTGGGRNTVINRLVATDIYHYIVSDTTRPPKIRDGAMERDGVNYFFRKESDLLRELQNGEFLEAEVIHSQQVSGTSIRELQKAHTSGKIAVCELEYGGINNIAQAKPDTHVIGILPPTYEEWIRRFRDREEIHEQEFVNRLHTAEKVLENMINKSYFRIAINDDIEDCVSFVRKVVEKNEYTDEDRDYGLNVAVSILEKVRESLKIHNMTSTASTLAP